MLARNGDAARQLLASLHAHHSTWAIAFAVLCLFNSAALADKAPPRGGGGDDPTGACCFEFDPCEELSFIECDQQGGQYQGDDVPCAPNPCPTGGCCLILRGGNCVNNVTFEECINTFAGIFLGFGIPCDVDQNQDLICPEEPTGACCFDIAKPVFGNCENATTQDYCEVELGGTYQGDNTECEFDGKYFFCPEPPLGGACCNDLGTCYIAPSGQVCEINGGIYIGDGTTCILVLQPVQRGANGPPQLICPTSGSCCLPTGACIDGVDIDQCNALAGAFIGAGSTCGAPRYESFPALAIPDVGPAVFDSINIPDSFTISSLRVEVRITHTFVGDLHINLEHVPSATTINLWTQSCAGSSNINTTFVDGGLTVICAQISVPGGEVDPINLGFGPALSTFNGLDASGEWRLHITDVFAADIGTLDRWALHFTTDDDLCPGPDCPDPLPGRPLNGERVLRGFLVGWAVNAQTGEEIRWNHLSGGAMLLNFRDSAAWEYTAYAAPVTNDALHGQPTGTPGVLNLGIPDPITNLSEYASGFDFLLLDFYAIGNGGFGSLDARALRTFLTLLPLDLDLRQNTTGPTITKAEILIWNENEFKLSGTRRCIFCWDQFSLTQIDDPNGFLITNLQTNKGRARIDGIAHNSQNSPPPCYIDFNPNDGLPLGADPRDILSRPTSMVGVTHKLVSFGAGGVTEEAGTHLVGTGTQPAVITWDYQAVGGGGGSPEAPVSTNAPDDFSSNSTQRILDTLNRAVERATRTNSDNRGAIPEFERISTSNKGSLIIWPKIELKFDNAGNLIADTYITLSNDSDGDVRIQFFFVQGDDAIFGNLMDGPCSEPGCNNFDFAITLTGNQPVYWRASDGLPLGIPSFIQLDPGLGP